MQIHIQTSNEKEQSCRS